MTEKVHRDGSWWQDFAYDSWKYSPPGAYDLAVQRTPTIVLDGLIVHQLIAALDDAGWIVPRLDERLRMEDLKITHRLLDIIEKSQGRA